MFYFFQKVIKLGAISHWKTTTLPMECIVH
nr:MAG TPA: hypothetical protein [Inoviridae sp.]